MAKCKHRHAVWLRANGSATNIDDPDRRRLVCVRCDATIPFGEAVGGEALPFHTLPARGRDHDDANAWPWDPSRPVAGQYEERLVAEQGRHDVAASAERHADLPGCGGARSALGPADRPIDWDRNLDAMEDLAARDAEPDCRDEDDVHVETDGSIWLSGPQIEGEIAGPPVLNLCPDVTAAQVQPPTVSENLAVAIYVIMDREPVDALEMVSECDDVSALNTLLVMLTHPGSDSTNRSLNAMFVEPVTRRITALTPAADQQVDVRFDIGGDS